jgi:hypothetical protein
MRVFDWDQAARRIAEQRPSEASAGLRDDWEYTGGVIYADGAPVESEETYTYLASTWAVPDLELDGVAEACWIWEDQTEWDAKTYWPESARKILADA